MFAFTLKKKGFSMVTLLSCLNNNKIALFSFSSLPYRQLRNISGVQRQFRIGSLPYRQLRKLC